MNKYGQSTSSPSSKPADISKSASNVSTDGKFNKADSAKSGSTPVTMGKDASASNATTGSNKPDQAGASAAKVNPTAAVAANAKTDAAKHV